MKAKSLNLKTISEMKPNEKWWIICLFLVISGGGVYLGVTELFGLKINPTNQHAPLVLIVIGILVGIYATILAKNREIALQNHSLLIADKRKKERPTDEPSQGDEYFFKVFSANSPMNQQALESLEVAHDKAKNKSQLLSTINILRLRCYAYRGKAVQYGNTYYTREHFNDKLKSGA